MVCLAIGVVAFPPVFAGLATADGRIDSPLVLRLLWIASIALAAGGLALGLAAGQAAVVDAVATSFRRWCRHAALVVLAALGLGAVGVGVYAWQRNHVDLLAHIDGRDPFGRRVQEIQSADGREAAEKALLDHSLHRPSTTPLLPYQLWDVSPAESDRLREAFLAGRLGEATGTPDYAWRLGDEIAWNDLGSSTVFSLRRSRKDPGWTFVFQGQRFLLHVLRDPKALDASALQAALAFVHEWRRGNRAWPNLSPLVWHNDCSPNRIQAHMLLMDRLRDRGESTPEEERAFLESLVQHAEYLADDWDYMGSTNHGMMQNAALLQIALGYPEFDREGLWRRTALERTLRYVREAVGPDGAILERAPGYHWFGALQLTWFVAVAQHAGLPIDPELEAAVRRSLAFSLELLQPDLSLPQIGDTDGSQRMSTASWPLAELSSWPELGDLQAATSAGVLPNQPGARYWPDARYFVLRSPAPSWDQAHALMLLLNVGMHSRAHQHHDVLSLALYANGTPLFGGSGYPNFHDMSERVRLLGTPYQSTVSVDGGSQQDGGGSLRFFEVRERADPSAPLELVAAQAESLLYPGVVHRRAILYGPSPTEVLLVDELMGSQEHLYRQSFQLGDGLEAAALPDGSFTVRRGGATPLRLKALLVGTGAARPAAGSAAGRSIAFEGRGKRIVFATRIQLGADAGTLRAAGDGGSLDWRGARGRLTVEFPLESGGSLRFVPSSAPDSVPDGEATSSSAR